MATRGLHHLSFLILACILSSTDCAKQSYESAETLNRSSFPAGFVFGASSASYQSEGAAFQDGRGLSIWDTFTHYYPEKIEDHSTGAVADEFYYSCNYKEDILLMKNIGLDAFRFSISWPRILPKGKISGGVNPLGVQFYNNLINEVLSRGLQPYVTLFHWDLPQALDDDYGGFLSAKIVGWWPRGQRIAFPQDYSGSNLGSVEITPCERGDSLLVRTHQSQLPIFHGLRLSTDKPQSRKTATE